jgi:lipopolysaccharide export LptBFGC system permease protein LptF
MVMLHAYILRELLKTFGLTLLALTALFTMGGGLYNVLKFEGVTTGDLFTLLPMLIPVTLTITMPVAALFAATMTYGRLAADNELVACRAAGINIHRVFLSAILLSVFVAALAAISVNVLIPDFMQKIAHFAKANVRDLAFHRLLQRGYIEYGKAGTEQYMLTAQQVKSVSREALVSKGFDPPGRGTSYFWVEQPTFLMIDESGELERFSVAEGGLCQFDTRDKDIEFTLYVINARDYEVGKRVVQIGKQKIGPYARAIPFLPKPSMVKLATLRDWLAAPWKAPKLEDEIDKFLGRLRAYVFYGESARRLGAGEPLVLNDNVGARYEIEAHSLTAGRKELVLEGVKVAKYDARRGGSRSSAAPIRYEALLAKLHAKPFDNGETLITLELSQTAGQPVREYNPHAGGGDTPREKESLRLDGLLLPEYVLDRMRFCTPAAVLGRSVELPTSAELGDERLGLQESAEKLRRQIRAVIHFRFGFAGSPLVTVLMGAALGVVFRGSRALAAFGLACIPFGIVTVLMLMGRQLTESLATEIIGPYVTWGGLALVGLADGLILRLGVRR